MKKSICALFLMNFINPVFALSNLSGVVETGTLVAVDKNKKPILLKGAPVTLEWCKTSDSSTMLAMQKSVLTLLAEVFADDETRMLLLDDKFQLKKEYVDIVNVRFKDKPDELNRFAASAHLDRKKRIEISYDQWKKWFEKMSRTMKNFCFEYFFITAKDSNGNILGVVAFYSSSVLTKFSPKFSEYTAGDIVLDPIAVTPGARGLGLARALVFSILTLAPQIKRILVSTRIWATKAQAVYKALGFSEYARESINVKFMYLNK
jgi:ribosomal protein S18 acetylase RimI-like enzyme